MKRALPVRLSDLRGIHRLASDATVGITDLVESCTTRSSGRPVRSARSRRQDPRHHRLRLRGTRHHRLIGGGAGGCSGGSAH
jgi:hypothetical protein